MTNKIPIKKKHDFIIHVRVNRDDIKDLQKANIDIPELIRQHIAVTLMKIKSKKIK